MAEHGDEETVRILRVDDDLRNLLAVAKTEVRPGLARVGRFVDAVAGRQIRPLQPFPAADVNDVRIRRGHRQRADRSRRLIVEDRVPGDAVVGRLPHAAVGGGDVEDVGLLRDAGRGLHAPAAERPDGAPAQFLEDSRIRERWPSGRLRNACGQRCRKKDGGRSGKQVQAHAWHAAEFTANDGRAGQKVPICEADTRVDGPWKIALNSSLNVARGWARKSTWLPSVTT